MKQYYSKNYQAPTFKVLGKLTLLFLLLANFSTFSANSFNGATVKSAQTICSGSTPAALTLAITTCTGSAAYSISAYEWQVSNDNGKLDAWAKPVAGSGATTASYTPPALTSSKYYRCKITVSNYCASITSPNYYTASILIKVNAAPSITTQPSNKTVCSGSSATFTVVATGSGLTYQWQKLKPLGLAYANISGATSASYTFTTAGTDDGYKYKCVVTNSCGSATSNAVSLTVNSAPSITTPPSSQTVCADSSATFTVVASGSGLTYQWQKLKPLGLAYVDISGATSASYTFTTASTDDGYKYKCVVTNSCGSATSTAVSLTVNSAPSITTPPSSQTICADSSATFTVVASGSGLTYQWQKFKPLGLKYVDISGATSASYSFTSASTDDGYKYKCVVTNSCGSATSTAVSLTVNSAPSISTQPSSQTVCADSSATFTVVASGSGLTYQWKKLKPLGIAYANISGATSASYSFTTASTDDGYKYKCVVSNSCGSATSNAVSLTVNSAPSISTQPSSETVCADSSVTFTVVASGSGLTYQWKKLKPLGLMYVDISGATSASYSFTTASTDDGYKYKCVVSNSCGSATTTAVSLTVNSAPSITAQPSSQTVSSGSSATFSVTASGSGLTYQWQSCATSTGTFANVSSGTGATSSTYSFTTASSDNGYYYHCVVSGTCTPSVTSSAVSLTVETPISITVQPAPATVYDGTAASFTIIASGTGLTYQWQKSTTAGGTTFASIGGATNMVYSFVAGTADNGYLYRCIVSGTSGTSVTSTSVPLTVRSMPTIAGEYSFVYSGTSTTYSKSTSLLSASGTPPDTYIDINNRASGKKDSVPGVSYSYTELSASTAKTFYNDFMYRCVTSPTTCYSKLLNSFKLVAVLNTGDVDNLGTGIPYTVQVVLAVKDPAATALNKSITLNISENSPEQVYQIEIDPSEVLEFSQANITISSITVTPTAPAAFVASLKSSIALNVYFDIDYGIDVSGESDISMQSMSSPITDNPVKLKWTNSSTCNENISSYEIQILRLFNTKDAYADEPQAVYAEVDWSKSLVIVTENSNTSLKLTLTEGTGYYIWRIRPIGNYYEGGFGDSRNYGNWATSAADGDIINLSAISSLTTTQQKYIFYYKQFDSDKNWIYKRYLSEEAKINEGITYADGLAMPHQTQKKLQEQNKVSTSQSLYDYVGRKGIQTITAPITQTKLAYMDTLVQDKNKNLYGPDDFDSDDRYNKPRYPVCAGDSVDVPVWENAYPMYGAISKYFSNSNPDINVPNAENYPYSRTVYDKLGRPKKTSLYGYEHHMGLYDETYMLGGLQRTVRTYYSAVADSELITVFGDETPADTGIYKIVKVDPNEVPTVTYKTTGGQIIATCMVNTGDHPLLEDISEVNNTITKEIKGSIQADPYTMIKEQSIVFTDPTIQLDVDYLLNKDEFEANCVTYCSTCDYIVDLYVIREETNEIKWEYKDTITPGECGGDLIFNPDGADSSESMSAYYDETCPQLVLGTGTGGDVSVIMLSDPGSYRIGRKITVNSKYNGEARYRDYHADKIDTLLDNEASKFDTLISLLNDTTGSLTDLYSYLDDLSSGSTSACDDETDESGNAGRTSFDFASRFGSGISTKFGSGSSSKSSMLSGSITKTGTAHNNEIWQVSYDSTNTPEGYTGTYTLASSCLEIEVPEIPCDFNPCDALWKTTGSEDWQTDLISQYGGYYDYESMLTDKNGDTYGNDLYKYFYDKYGAYKYPANMQDQATITITGSTSEAYVTYEEGIIIDDSKAKITICLSSGNDGTSSCDFFNMTLEPAYIHSRYNVQSDGSRGSHVFDYATVEEFTDEVYNTLQPTLAIYGYSVTVSHSNNKGVITISYNFDNSSSDATSPSTNHSLSVSDTKASGESFTGTGTNFVRSDEDFSGGNGAFNSMVTHMIMEDKDGTDGDDYDCYDMYLVWEGIVNDYPSLYEMMVTSTGTDLPGLDLLDYFLSFTGKKYSGFSNEPYGSNGGGSVYGYGYLEYAYKSFELDTVPLSASQSQKTSGYPVVDEQEVNCAKLHGVIYDTPIDEWTNPEEWDETSCGSNAWWGGMIAGTIADDINESDTCKAWNSYYECLNSDLDLYAGEISSAIGTACNNSPDATCFAEFSSYLKERTIDVIEKRELGFSNQIKYTLGITRALANTRAYRLRDYLEDAFDLTVQKDGSGNITSIGTTDQLNTFYNLHNKGLEVSETATGSYTYIPASSKKMSEILSDELNTKFRKSASVTKTEVTNELDNLYDKFGWSKTKLTSKITPAFSSMTSITRHSSVSKMNFSVSSGKIILNNIVSRTGAISSVVVADLALDDDVINLDGIYYNWGNSLSAITNPMRTLSIAVDCDSRNLTYLINQINYALDDAKTCRLDKSLAEYDEHCALPTSIHDSLVVSYSVDYHQYTLFYYDIAGNLIKVVPPKGVDEFDRDTDGDGVGDAIPSRQDVKNHKYATTYKYNSVGQMVYEETPDGGAKYYYYNSIGQLRFAQNANDLANGIYEYQKYDALGNLIEGGISSLDTADNNFLENVDDEDFPTSQLLDRKVIVYGNGSESDIIKYIDGITEQKYLESRIQYSYSDPDGTDGNGDEIYTYYSYNPHGNVQWVADSIPGVAMKYIFYDYDLLSGKVKAVKYNEGMTDQFQYRYTYDSDNRLIAVETSRDNVIWDLDAKYEYYAYGPLKRCSIGEDNVQGLDYVYTLNGWLKAINHQSLSSKFDPGGDGTAASTFGQDVFGITFGYYNGDFKRKYKTDYSVFNSEFNDDTSQYFNTGKMQLAWDYDNADRGYDKVDNTQAFDYRPLFNGAITNVAYSTQASNEASVSYDGKIKGFKYKYDELYRLVESNFDFYNTTQKDWTKHIMSTPSSLTDYNTSYTYDLMGNITSLTRYGVDNKKMDELTYHYEDKDGDGVDDNNRLSYITDNISSSDYTYQYDLENQSTNNYSYDDIGQLIGDNAEGIKSIDWSRTNKVKTVIKETLDAMGGTTHTEINFTYDALDRRVSKNVTIKTKYRTPKVSTTEETTYYINDANGNEMGIYTVDASGAKISEQPIYASGRIGMVKADKTVTLASNTASTTSTNIYTRTIKQKNYEIKDNLSNVRAVIYDAKETNASGTFYADLISSNDYYPYGMIMPKSDYKSGDYRYGYQSMERDDELKDGGNSYDFGARILDPRAARWLSTDPLAAKFPWQSPYVSMDDDPINRTDFSGSLTDESLTGPADKKAMASDGPTVGTGEGTGEGGEKHEGLGTKVANEEAIKIMMTATELGVEQGVEHVAEQVAEQGVMRMYYVEGSKQWFGVLAGKVYALTPVMEDGAVRGINYTCLGTVESIAKSSGQVGGFAIAMLFAIPEIKEAGEKNGGLAAAQVAADKATAAGCGMIGTEAATGVAVSTAIYFGWLEVEPGGGTLAHILITGGAALTFGAAAALECEWGLEEIHKSSAEVPSEHAPLAPPAESQAVIHAREVLSSGGTNQSAPVPAEQPKKPVYVPKTAWHYDPRYNCWVSPDGSSFSQDPPMK